MHRIIQLGRINYLHKFLGEDIRNYNFIKCSNNHCSSIFPIKIEELNGNTQNFCPTCQVEMLKSHLVQCENCQSILNFIPLLEGEEAAIFYVDHCKECANDSKENKLPTPTMIREYLI